MKINPFSLALNIILVGLTIFLLYISFSKNDSLKQFEDKNTSLKKELEDYQRFTNIVIKNAIIDNSNLDSLQSNFEFRNSVSILNKSTYLVHPKGKNTDTYFSFYLKLDSLNRATEIGIYDKP